MTTPSFTVDRVDTTRDIWLDIADGPVLTKKYGKRQFRVTRVHITYRRTDQDAWRWAGFQVRGPYVKVNGTDALDHTDESYYQMQDVAERGFWALVEQHMPGAAL